MAAVWVRVVSARVRLLLAASQLSSRMNCEEYYEIENIIVLVVSNMKKDSSLERTRDTS